MILNQRILQSVVSAYKLERTELPLYTQHIVIGRTIRRFNAYDLILLSVYQQIILTAGSAVRTSGENLFHLPPAEIPNIVFT